LYKVTAALNRDINETFLWTDSSIVLSWIQGLSSKWKTFVGNRVATIQEDTHSAIWRHVPSQSNPADLISWGTDPVNLSSSTLGWKGPHWLAHKPSCWPNLHCPTSTNIEVCQVHTVIVHIPADLTQRFSILSKLITVIAYCRRFIGNCRQQESKRQFNTLSKELNSSLLCCVKLVQKVAYA
jgi:hypothetical protein